ncbi:ABC transporter ATP-binding protein [Marispirochaeta sp.]|uniref:ABC transporter ATP-binding protein n=1 Tax=Marispirochaeta sp. TaxID=2038653 RepID=UPI0029C93EC6|nr:ABC transporter ATP-binding protein [Marispirochaeta sp.]
MANTILCIQDLHVEFQLHNGTARILNGVNLDTDEGSLLGLVGESGSGKSVLAMAMLNYVREPGKIRKGKIIFNEKDVFSLSEKELREVYRGKEIGLIAANARSHLNPLLPVGKQIANVYMAHTGRPKSEAREKAVEILKLVGINDAERRMNSYPHELSGGMAQRVMIAITLVNAPKFIIADDCTNGLDVTVAAQVMDLFLEIIKKQKSSGMLITHDLGIVAQCCDDVAIMYSGRIFEKAPVEEFFQSPAHPYSLVLLESLPEKRKLKSDAEFIGTLPNPLRLSQGCLFHPHCSRCKEICTKQVPELKYIGNSRTVYCHFPLIG